MPWLFVVLLRVFYCLLASSLFSLLTFLMVRLWYHCINKHTHCMLHLALIMRSRQLFPLRRHLKKKYCPRQKQVFSFYLLLVVDYALYYIVSFFTVGVVRSMSFLFVLCSLGYLLPFLFWLLFWCVCVFFKYFQGTPPKYKPSPVPSKYKTWRPMPRAICSHAGRDRHPSRSLKN